MGSPELGVFVSGRLIATAACDEPQSAHAASLTIGELDRVAFELTDLEADVEYRIRVGDLPIFVGDPLEPGVGRLYRRLVVWEDASHFESARGFVPVFLESRISGANSGWKIRTKLSVNVIPTKLTESRYMGMVRDLATLSAGLLFDLVSKSWRAGRYWGRVGVSVRPPHLELRRVQQTAAVLPALLREIERNPHSSIQQQFQRRPWTGAFRSHPTALIRLAAVGIDPRRVSPNTRASWMEPRVVESRDVLEHQIIRGFVELLLARLRKCRSRIEHQRCEMESQRRYRDVSLGGARSLYEEQDVPRLERLRAAEDDAVRTERSLNDVLAKPLFAGVKPTNAIVATPVFHGVSAYRRVLALMTGYLSAAALMLDPGDVERLKATSRLYEQWVLLQCLAAFYGRGFRPVSQTGIFRRETGRDFVVDIERDATVLFGAADGRAIRVRYEPWIVSRPDAEQGQHSLYRGAGGSTPWSPDVVIEVGEPLLNVDDPFRSTYVVVVDAKYSRVISERHWNGVSKYREIRTRVNHRPVVKQIWIAYPSDSSVRCRDSALSWSPNGPSCPSDDVFEAEIGMEPDELSEDENADLRLTRGAQELVDGFCRYLSLDPLAFSAPSSR